MSSLGLGIIIYAIGILVAGTLSYFIIRDAVAAGMLKYDRERKKLAEKQRP